MRINSIEESRATVNRDSRVLEGTSYSPLFMMVDFCLLFANGGGNCELLKERLDEAANGAAAIWAKLRIVEAVVRTRLR